MTKNINFFSHHSIPLHQIQKAYAFIHDIDKDDILFLAFSLHFEANLWTGDKKLIKGLEEKGISTFYTTDELINDFKKRLRDS